MYNAVFEADNGRVYYFGVKGKTLFDMDVGEGVSADIGTSQGYLQIGETVENYTISGRNITVTGVIYDDIQNGKKRMRGVFAPFTSGRLTIDGKYYIRVYVKDAPSFSPVRDNGKFSMLLYAPYPYFKEIQTESVLIGEIVPQFSFPVNYQETHLFGTKEKDAVINIYNGGDVKSQFSVIIQCSGVSKNVIIRNLYTFEELKLNGEFLAGDVAMVYKGEDGILRAELTRNGDVIDILSWVDDDSDFFELQIGDNLISATDDAGGENLFVNVVFSNTVVAVYED